MPTLTTGDMKVIVAKYLDHTTLADYIESGVDLLELGMNNARRTVEKVRDFTYSRDTITFSIGSGGSALTGASVSVKRVEAVSLPVAGSEYMPIEFMTNAEWRARQRKQIGRSEYSASATLEELGVSNRNPICYQQGRSLYLYPETEFTFPVAAKLDVVKFLDDYEEDDDTDFFLEFGADFIQWQTVLELNKFRQSFVTRQEGNVTPEEIEKSAATALQALLAWDDSIAEGTGTPPSKRREK